MNMQFTGRQQYTALSEAEGHRLVVAVFTTVGQDDPEVLTLFDTGSEWCILEPAAASAVGVDLEQRGDYGVCLHSRFGLLAGRLERLPLTLPAQHGAHLIVEATWFVSPEWPGPRVLGWRGCMERFCFGFDPAGEWFHFGPATHDS